MLITCSTMYTFYRPYTRPKIFNVHIGSILINLQLICSTMYLIVAFDDTEETDYLPLLWAVDENIARGENPSNLEKTRANIVIYWLPWKNFNRLVKAKKMCIEPQMTWPQYNARVLGTAGKHQITTC